MDEMMVKITGDVKNAIMIDPGVWIFDERRVDMDKIFDEKAKSSEERNYAAIGRAFDEQRMKGASPQTNENKVTISKKDLNEKSLGIGLAPFFANAAPNPEASMVRIHRSQDLEEVILPLKDVSSGIAAFSKKGNPLKETGPLHFYYQDGSNRDNPITHVSGFTVAKP